jgi:hypothetical protein
MFISQKKRKCLLTCARKNNDLVGTNNQLQELCLEPVHAEEWNLWLNYYEPIVRNDPYFEHELLINARPLTWFARELNQRKKKYIS